MCRRNQRHSCSSQTYTLLTSPGLSACIWCVSREHVSTIGASIPRQCGLWPWPKDCVFNVISDAFLVGLIYWCPCSGKEHQRYGSESKLTLTRTPLTINRCWPQAQQNCHTKCPSYNALMELGILTSPTHIVQIHETSTLLRDDDKPMSHDEQLSGHKEASYQTHGIKYKASLLLV